MQPLPASAPRDVLDRGARKTVRLLDQRWPLKVIGRADQPYAIVGRLEEVAHEANGHVPLAGKLPIGRDVFPRFPPAILDDRARDNPRQRERFRTSAMGPFLLDDRVFVETDDRAVGLFPARSDIRDHDIPRIGNTQGGETIAAAIVEDLE